MQATKKPQNRITISSVLTLYSKPKFITIFFLGFSSGLPLLLTSSILAYWLRSFGISIEVIGLLSLVAMPYALKFLWAPLLDKTHLPWLGKKLGQRRAMAILTQLLLIATIVALGFTDPLNNILQIIVIASLLSFFSASQDMMIDGIRVEMVKDKEQAAAAAMAVTGYRLALLLIGGGIPILSDSVPWMTIFLLVAAVQLIGLIGVLAAPRLGEAPRRKTYKSSLNKMGDYFTKRFWQPLKDFFERQPKAITLLLFLIFYKYGDAFMGIMAYPFYLDTGFTGVEIGTIVKYFGFTMTILGGFIGGAMVFRYGFMPTLWVGGVAQAAANVFFVVLAVKGNSTEWLMTTIAVDNFSGGLGTAAFVGFMARLVNAKHSVTQLALLTSFSAIGRNMLSAPAGYAAAYLGYPWFFALSILLAIPGLWLLRQLHAAPKFMKLAGKKK